MAEITHEYSNFPNQIFVRNNFLDLKDAPASVVYTVTQIKSLIANGNYSAAAKALDDNKNVLAQYMIDAKYINHMEEEIRNLEIYTKSKIQGLYYQLEEPDGVTGDVWIA